MNFLTEYKDEVGSLCLSAEFKEDLKKACISEAAKAVGEDEKPRIEATEGGASNKDVLSKMKLYKYISIAACLIAAVSSIGVISLMTSKIQMKSADNRGIVGDYYESPNESAEESDDISLSDFDGDYDADESADEPVVASNGIEPLYDEPVEGYDATDNAIAVDDPVEESDSELPQSDMSTYSISMNSPDYDGDYNTEDYVLMLTSSAQVKKTNVYDDRNGLDGAMTEEVGSADNGDDVLDPADSPIEEPEDEAYDYDAYNFYDLLSGRLKSEAESGGASLVRMRITGIDSRSSSPAPAGKSSYTPYSVNIEYDYLNQTGCNVNARVWIKGTEDNQIDGMPIYEEGDIILTSLYVNKNGSVTVVDELLYDVYTMSEQDIAYHRYYDKINPGYTDMGILDEERSFVTTTENNPVEYVHKAVTKELSRYIRRKIVGENYDFVDLEWLGKVSFGEAEPWQEPEPETEDNPQTPDDAQQSDNQSDPEIEPIKNARVRTTDEKMIITFAGEQVKLGDEASCEYIGSTFKNSASSTNSTDYYSIAMFVGGKLTFSSTEAFKGGLTEIEITNVGCPLDLSFNGVSVGDSLESAVKTLGIKDPLDPNCTLTYKGTTITATMKFEYGTLAKIVIK